MQKVQETSAVTNKCQNAGKQVSEAPAFLPVVNCVNLASAFRHQHSGIGIPASGSVRYCWLQINPSLPSFVWQAMKCMVPVLFKIFVDESCNSSPPK
jgi:hypothetical protein